MSLDKIHLCREGELPELQCGYRHPCLCDCSAKCCQCQWGESPFSAQDCPSEHWNNSLNPAFIFQVKYKEEFHKTKDKYTTVTETVDSERVQSLKHLYSDVSVYTHFFFLWSTFNVGFLFYFVCSHWLKINIQTRSFSKPVLVLCTTWAWGDVFQARAILSNCNASLGKTPGLINGFPE